MPPWFCFFRFPSSSIWSVDGETLEKWLKSKIKFEASAGSSIGCNFYTRKIAGFYFSWIWRIWNFESPMAILFWEIFYEICGCILDCTKTASAVSKMACISSSSLTRCFSPPFPILFSLSLFLLLRTLPSSWPTSVEMLIKCNYSLLCAFIICRFSCAGMHFHVDFHELELYHISTMNEGISPSSNDMFQAFIRKHDWNTTLSTPPSYPHHPIE